ncbi:hypothetical protein E3G52_000319 [Mycobacteroides abscessus]|uniref:hypothetical protein n=1 Tax=Mycobacteroides abscessus TaxID=36809 RepID=UPI001877B11F|nr:hypothetical protein [Mycobacteroides abscessus]MBE5453455.1 hypothetical protein [Mycobacteroides abscessus]
MSEIVSVLTERATPITLHRNDKQWPLPFETNRAANEFVRHKLYDTMHPGDVLDLPFRADGAVIEIGVWPPNARDGSDPHWFMRKTNPSPFRITLQFMAFDKCPHCGLYESAHQVEVPEYETWVDDWQFMDFPHRRYVLRTCIACRNSWEQDAL